MKNKGIKTDSPRVISVEQANDIYNKLEAKIVEELKISKDYLLLSIREILSFWLSSQEDIKLFESDKPDLIADIELPNIQNPLENESTNPVDIQVPTEQSLQK